VREATLRSSRGSPEQSGSAEPRIANWDSNTVLFIAVFQVPPAAKAAKSTMSSNLCCLQP
jgi:hypothetical protein